MRKHLILLISLLLLQIKVFGNLYVVVSKNDTGTGSLREAIILANANAGPDVINFNLPGNLEGDITILLNTELPALSSDLIIDGTSQPVSVLGNPAIRINLIRFVTDLFFSGLKIEGSRNIEIYGINFRNFTAPAGSPIADKKAGIFLKGAYNIKIGSPGKQNSFGASYAAIFSPYDPAQEHVIEQITISANIIGLSPDGTTAVPNEIGIDVGYLKNSIIGGAGPGEGNLISSNRIFGIGCGAMSGTVSILNNVIGLDITKTKTFPVEDAYGIYGNGNASTLFITGNMIGGQAIGIRLENVNTGFTLRGNIIGTGSAGAEKFNNEIGINIFNCAYGTIGGAAAADKNTIAYNGDALIVEGSYPVTITRNSIYCNSKSGITFIKVPAGKTITQSKITILTPTRAAGTYLPGSVIELFYDDECPDCQGKVWIASIPTSADGSWEYNGVLTGNITSTGTNADGATSAFSKPIILDQGKAISDTFCGQLTGSIKNITVTDASIIEWYNASNQRVGTQADLVNVAAGVYYLVVGQPGGCTVSSQPFTIKNTDIIYKVKTSSIIPATCATGNGAISIVWDKDIPLNYEWKDQNGNIVSSAASPSGLMPGTYKIAASNGQGCTTTIQGLVVEEIPLHSINTANIMYVLSCDGTFITVKGVEVSGVTAPYKYIWYNDLNEEVFNGQGLTGVKPGFYSLTVTDKNNCTVSSAALDFSNGIVTALKIPSAFTPNSDGINDTWKITGASSYPDGDFSVFNRYGELVFTSKGYTAEFAGTMNNKKLPIGVYYYVIDLKNKCPKLYGSVTLIK